MDGNCAVKPTYQRAWLGTLAVVVVLLFSPLRAWPWGCDGHQAVAMIAEKHMSTHALAMANQLLKSQPIDPTLSRYCSSQGLDLMADASTWADDLRSTRPEASPWHYIDIPRGAPRSAEADSCPAATGCVTSALAHQLELLRSDSTEPRVRADALRFIIHFVGDMHQPLHCVDNNDLGGNCVPVDFFGIAPMERNPQFESYSPNLHAIWDTGILTHLRGAQSVADWADSLDNHFSSWESGWVKDGIKIEDWAWESHELADSVVYAKLPVAIAVEKPVPMKGCMDADHASTRFLKLHEQIAQPYVDAVGPIANEQIVKAGVRLAFILNQVWP